MQWINECIYNGEEKKGFTINNQTGTESFTV